MTKRPAPRIPDDTRRAKLKAKAKSEAGGKTLGQIMGEDADTSRAGQAARLTRTPVGMKKR